METRSDALEVVTCVDKFGQIGGSKTLTIEFIAGFAKSEVVDMCPLRDLLVILCYDNVKDLLPDH